MKKKQKICSYHWKEIYNFLFVINLTMLLYLRFAGLQRWQSSAAAPASAVQKNLELNNRLPTQDLRIAQTNVEFNVEAMTALVDHDNHEMRAKFRYG